jgi:hypothetical protein
MGEFEVIWRGIGQVGLMGREQWIFDLRSFDKHRTSFTIWFFLRLPGRCAPRNDGARARRRLRLLGIFLDAGLSTVATAERGLTVAEPVDIEAIMKWLAEIWLDPDVQKSIDHDKFLKVYEWLKELSNQ